MRSLGVGVVLWALPAWVGGMAGAQFFPVNAEFQVNTYTSGSQTRPAVDVAATGDFVVVWQSFGQDGDEYGLFGRRFGPDGSPIAPAFPVHANGFGEQQLADIDSDGAGNFVVVWQTDRNGSLDIFARRFSSNGQAIGLEFQVNSYSTGTQRFPEVAVRGDGGFVVVWESSEYGPSEGIIGRRYDATGTALGTAFQVNDYTSGIQSGPTIGIEDDGDFVVAWSGAGQGALGGVWARRFASSGAPQGASFAVSVHTDVSHLEPAIGIGVDGSFVVAWQEYTVASSTFDISARRVGGVTPIGAEFTVNNHTLRDEASPTIAIERDGEFVIAWESAPVGDSETDIFARRFGASGGAEGGEFRVNTHLPESQVSAAIAVDPLRPSFVVAWSSGLQDGGGAGIFAQRYGSLSVDIDGNGVADPLTDGLLFLRYLFGFRGETLTNGVVADDCTRCTADEIEAYIDSIL